MFNVFQKIKYKNNILLYRKRSFTLIEVLIATSVFVLTIMVLSQIFISVIHSEKIAYSLLNTENVLRNNLELMARAIRMGTKFTSNSDSQLCFINSANQNQCFYFNNYSLFQSINGTESSLINSDNSNIKIYKGSFKYFNAQNAQPLIMIQIWAQTTVKDQVYNFKVETSVTPRTIEIEE